MDANETARDTLAERLLDACVAGLDLLHVYVETSLASTTSWPRTDR